MINILARLVLYAGDNKRRTAFLNGYRPLFKVGEHDLLSGSISLLDREEFSPGDEGVVEIRFFNADIHEGQRLYFYEALEPLGECTVLRIINVEKSGSSLKY